MVLLGIVTLFATLAWGNGCIHDLARAWFAMGRDPYLPAWFGAVNPVERTPYRAILFLVAKALVFALGAPLDQVITSSVLSGLPGYTFMPIDSLMFRRKRPLDMIKRGFDDCAIRTMRPQPCRPRRWCSPLFPTLTTKRSKSW